MNLIGKLAIVIVALGCASVAQADPIMTFTDRASWEAAVLALGGQTVTEPFSKRIAGADSITLDSGIISTANPGLLQAGLNEIRAVESSPDTPYRYVGRVGALASDHPPTITWQFPMLTFGFFGEFGSLSNGLNGTGNFDGMGDTTIGVDDIIGVSGSFGIVGVASFTSFNWGTDSPSEAFVIDSFSFAKGVLVPDPDPPSVPVPEPGTLALLGLGIFGLGLSRRRTIRRHLSSCIYLEKLQS